MAEVWGTQSLNQCPEKSWRSLDPAVIQKTYGAAAIVMNGPHLKMVDGGSGMDLSGAIHHLFNQKIRQISTRYFVGLRRIISPIIAISAIKNKGFSTQHRFTHNKHNEYAEMMNE